jgi:hypothetical protein
MTDSRHVDEAIAELRSMGDPYRRLRQADELDAALATARTVVAQIRQDTIRSLRGPGPARQGADQQATPSHRAPGGRTDNSSRLMSQTVLGSAL